MNLISKAYAQAEQVAGDVAADMASVPGAPSAGEAFMWNMGMVLVLVAMFYLLLIRPQQKRFKEHQSMLNALKKGDKVMTGGGLLGKIEKISDASDEVVVDLGNGIKVTAMRSTLSQKSNADPAPANDSKPDAKADKAGKKAEKKK